MTRFVLVCTLVLSAYAAPIAQWQAARPPVANGIALADAPGSAWTMEQRGGAMAARIKPLGDYYNRASFLLKLEKPITEPAWLSIGYIDEGYGLISVNVAGARRRRAAANIERRGVVRLNTGKLRHAVFHVQKLDVELRIESLTLLHSVEITKEEPAREADPPAKPAFTLKNAPNLVTTAGADAPTPEGLKGAIENMRTMLPLVKALGFNGVESYVKWDFVERSPGVFDWSFYDAVVDELDRQGLKWFPLLIVGSAYSLPQWFHDSKEFTGFACLEHNIAIEIPTIFNENQAKYVRRFLTEFGKHYGDRKTLLGVRLGPSGNYGEAQYPASGNWGYKGGKLHTHLGYWAGDPDASVVFRGWVKGRYATVKDLNQAWGTAYASFDEVKTFHPVHAISPRMRIDFNNWYMDAMTEWCERWATWAREAMPRTSIYQSSGGWGAVEIGTDYIKHARTMGKLGGGIRLTNENDGYLNNFCVTRPAASSARFYGAKIGSEPAGYGSARGVMARLYNTIVNGADHLFYYDGNIIGNDQAVDAWIRHAPLLDRRVKPAIDIAVYYPDTPNRLSDEYMRHLNGNSFFPRAKAFRSVADYDFMGEQMILDGALDRYKALVFLNGNVTERAVIEKIDAWMRNGGTVIFPVRPQARHEGLSTVEEDTATWQRWVKGETGKGRLLLFTRQSEPLAYYMNFLREKLPGVAGMRETTKRALKLKKPEETYWAVLGDDLVLLNYADAAAAVRLSTGKTVRVEPNTIWMSDAGTGW
jgi:hypothetical protein